MKFNNQDYSQIWWTKFKKEVLEDKDYKGVLNKPARGKSVAADSLEPQAKLSLFKDRVVITRNHEIQLDIIQKHHDSLFSGHLDQGKTLKHIKRDFHWSGINKIIKEYISSCQSCSRNKKIHHEKFELLEPLQIPSSPWNFLSMDFLTQFPLPNSFDTNLLFVEKFSKLVIFIPTYSEITSLGLSQIFINHVFYKHGISQYCQ
ncbi:hypothetical protein O181_006733 [Austropuccinia psidii MF-1]|uniref:Integrase zinc-binding domain-containing protein n=1 Tax=Austropuccinia psidii MF-1 TaxID=1389203 RepID=A0A9Q3GGV7_9BASI|nr:hypothetical protein [Austropuccinia psidii MF-1]